MRRCLALLPVLLLVGSCARWSDVPGPALDVADFTLWQSRGATVGKMAQRYCVAGSERQRAWMREAMMLQSYPATVTITCTEPPT